MAKSVWGDQETEFFHRLGIDQVLDAVEAGGVRCTGRCLQLNSMENRVYEIEIELPDGYRPRTPAERFRIAKFYRPGRWTREQILEEHQFLTDLNENEIPAVAPCAFADGATLKEVPGIGIWYALFPKVGGRAPADLQTDELQRLGRLLARLHNVGVSRDAIHRMRLEPTTYGRANLEYLMRHNKVPAELAGSYRDVVERICDHVEPWFTASVAQRIHGDCHFGNILQGDQGFFLVDFDDMVVGPPVQDLWLLLPGRDEASRQQLEVILEAYQTMYAFDRATLRLVEPLRALRFVHFSAWIAKRWEDPAFQRAFPHVTEARYWSDQLHDLKEQWGLIEAIKP